MGKGHRASILGFGDNLLISSSYQANRRFLFSFQILNRSFAIVRLGFLQIPIFGHAIHHKFVDVTELRAGVYVFFDLVMHNAGVCRLDELALSVLTTVIGHQAEKG